MQRIFVDFGRGVGEEIDILTTADPNVGAQLREGETVLLYDNSLEVQSVLHAHSVDGLMVWSALPIWSTRRDLV